MLWSRIAQVLLIGVVLFAQGAPPAEARSVPTDSSVPEEFIKSGTVSSVVSEQVDVWTTGGGFYYWARNCFDDGFNPVSGISYLKRMPLGSNIYAASFDVETLFSISCSNANRAFFSSLYANDEGVFYAFAGTGGKHIQKRTVDNPTTAINLATFSGTLPLYRGITATPGSLLFWVEQNGSAGTVEAVQRNTGSRYLSRTLGNVTVSEIGSIDGKVFFVHSGGTFRANYFCLSFGDNCVDVNQFGGPISSMQFEGGGFTTPVANQNIYYISGNTVYRTPNPQECGSTAPACQSFVQYTATAGYTLTQFVRALDPSTSTTRLFAKEYEKTSCPPINKWCRAFIRRDNSAITIVELGRAGQSGDGSLTDNDIFGPLAVDTTYVVTENAGGYQELSALGGLVFNDVDKLSTVKFSANSLDRDLAWRPFMEINQSVQNLSAGVTGNVPLVANRSTIVRVWPSEIVGRSVRNPYAVLEGRRDGALLPGSPLQPYARPASVSTGDPAPDRGTLNSGFAFDLPLSWTDGSVELRAILDPNQKIVDTNRANNTLTATASFLRKTAVCLLFIPVRTTSAPTPSVSPMDSRVTASIDLFRRIWPVSDVRMFYQNEPVEELEIAPSIIPPRVTKYGPYEFADDQSKILTAISQREDLTDDPDQCDNINAVTYYIGVIDGGMPPSGIINLGLGRRPGSALWMNISASGVNIPSAANSPVSGVTLAHEMGHNAGRKHVLCPTSGDNVPKDTDASYPYSSCSIGPAGFTSNYGYDYATDTILAPTATGDLMSYSTTNNWPSDYTYKALVGAIAARAKPHSVGIQAVDPSVLVVSASGTVSPGAGTATIEPFLVLPAGPTNSKLQDRLAEASAPSASPYRIRLLDASGAEIGNQQFTPTDGSDGNPATLAFSTVFQAPAGTVAGIQILNGSTVLLNRSVGPSSPAVAFTAPPAGATVSGNLDVGWSAADADPADYLVHTLQFSSDSGQHWQTLFANAPGATPTGTFNYTIPAGTLAATSGASGMLRVLTSDGFNTAIAYVGSLTVAPSPPTVTIAKPNGGQPVIAGKDVKLTAAAVGSTGSAIASYAWKVDGSARGADQTIAVAGLTTGPHTADVTVTDDKGLTATASLTFSVDPLQIPVGSGTAPTADGFCDDPGYAGAQQLRLDPSTGGQGLVSLVRFGNSLHACFSGLALGAAGSPPFASLRLDTGTAASPADFAFSVSRTGTMSSTTGSARGAGTPTGAGALTAKSAIGDNGGSWNAEMIVDVAGLGGWTALRSIRLAETGIVTANDSQAWPYGIAATSPESWAALNAEGADLGVTLTAGTASPTSGVPFNYTMNVSNSGPVTATSTLVTLTLPSGMTGVTATSTQGACTIVSGQARCTVAAFAPGVSATIVVTGTVSSAPGSAVNASVVVSSSVVDKNPGNNAASVSGAIYTPPPAQTLGTTGPPGQVYRVMVPLGVAVPISP